MNEIQGNCWFTIYRWMEPNNRYNRVKGGLIGKRQSPGQPLKEAVEQDGLPSGKYLVIEELTDRKDSWAYEYEVVVPQPRITLTALGDINDV